jgi:DNA polymerase-1
MATLAARARAQGHPVWLVSPDKDLFQLVTAAPPAVRIWRPWRREIIDAAAVERALGVPAAAAVDWFALVGDSSDHIAGVRGVGPKAATTLLQAFGSLEGLYARLADVPSLRIRGAAALRERLAAGRHEAELAQRLVTLRADAPLPMAEPLAVAGRWRGPRPDADTRLAPWGLGGIAAGLHRVAAERQAPSPP